MFYKIIALSALIAGECLTIFAEIAAAKSTHADASIWAPANLRWTLLVMLGSVLLLVGYCMCQLAFRSIWVIYAASITTILIVEPTLAYFLFRELPSRGATLGIMLGGLGLLTTLVMH